ncbi:unnamed protein product, partial [Choristocarpus tenellus]
MRRRKAPYSSSGSLIPPSPVGPNSSAQKFVQGQDSKHPNNEKCGGTVPGGERVQDLDASSDISSHHEGHCNSQITMFRHLKGYDNQIALGGRNIMQGQNKGEGSGNDGLDGDGDGE